MSASQDLRDGVYDRANGRCECTMQCSHHRGARCPHGLRGPWEVHRISAGGAYTFSNVKGMCQTCHRNTPSYGRG